MDTAAIDEMAALEDHHWWFVGKRLIVRALLGSALARPGQRVLDVGCGTGGVLAAVGAQVRAVGVDRSLQALGYARRRGLTALASADGDRLPFTSGAFDVVLLLDVLEHFAAEDMLLAEVRRVLAPDGTLVVSVPAFQFLWSVHDETLAHKRRYTATRLRAALTRARFGIARITYTNVLALPPALVVRTVLPRLGLERRGGTDFDTVPAWLNGALVAGYRLESALLRALRLPVGLSVAAIAHPEGNTL